MAVPKRTVINPSDRVGNGNGCQTKAEIKCFSSNRGDGVGDGDRGQFSTATKCRISYGGDRVAYGNGCQTITLKKSFASNGCDGIWDGNGGQVMAVIKCAVLNSGDGVGDGDSPSIADVSNQGVSISIREYKIAISNTIH